ncbi:MAG: HD-GYP domain-containing protein [Coriobacteriales bacterium]|nr:HD-GYP domain-containing protein [Coriobacteriales bacterium]
MSTLEKIQRTGRMINLLCTIMSVILIIQAIIGVIGSIILCLNINFFNDLFIQATDNFLFQMLERFGALSSIPQNYVYSIQAFTSSIVHVFMLLILRHFQKFITSLSESGTPFKMETAQYMRKDLWRVAVLLFWNPLVAALFLIFILFMSFLVEYGAFLQEKADETSRIQEELIIQFAEITENKSGQTGQHIKRVSEYARVIAREMGLPEDRVEQIRLASTMHDIGKLLIPSEILDKPGRLTDEEFAIIKQHTTYGGQLLNNVEGDVMRLSRTIALDHHERWDGHGYAQGKGEDQISIEGRIVAVADVYDALTSRRSYKEAWDDREAYDEIVRCSGTQFDPQVVEAFSRRYEDINAIRKKFQD